MIEGPQTAGAPVRGGGASAPGPRLRPSFQDLVAGFLHRMRPQRSWKRTDPVLARLRLASRTAWVVLALFGAYVAMDLMTAQRAPEAPAPAAPAPAGTHDALVVADPTAKPLSEYLATITKRNPFTGDAVRVEQQAVKTARQQLLELASGLNVVGIDRGANPEAIIEDTVQNRTHFVRVGDTLNGMKILEIGSKGVVVGYDGEELQLQ